MKIRALTNAIVALFSMLLGADVLACGGMMISMPKTGVNVLGSKVRSFGAGLQASDIDQTAYSQAMDLDFCYENLLTVNPVATGLIMATIKIGSQGEITEMKINTRMPRDKEFEACIKSALTRSKYSVPSNGKEVVASTVFRFEPANPFHKDFGTGADVLASQGNSSFGGN